MNEFVAGQRWISEMEPELGMGTVLSATHHLITVLYPSSGETRNYAVGSMPLKRVRFDEGETAKDHENVEFTVAEVREEAGLITYITEEGREVPESLLNDSISFSKPQERLIAGIADTNELFEFRYETNRLQSEVNQSELRGFIGGKIDLIPHQLYISHEVSMRQMPRVMLCDEVGLGKTIEACLILHRLYQSNQVKRVLILLPENLMHQWFIELYRKFNLHFQIFDEDRCQAIQEVQKETNPFMDDSLIIAQLEYVSQKEDRKQQIIEADWDLVIIDEAHHLKWSPEKSSLEYDLVEQVSKNANGLLLLTATPQQLGGYGHFARLRLLDPDRFYDIEAYEEEVAHYAEVAKVTNEIIAGKKLTAKKKDILFNICKNELESIREKLEKAEAGDKEAKKQLIQNLLDQHGTGRVIFRNTRSAIKGFPERKLFLYPLEELSPQAIGALDTEFEYDLENQKQALADMDYSTDLRVDWLVKWLGKHKKDKVLLLCRSREKVFALDEALRQKIKVKVALFYEDLELLQRDRNAAYFAEEDGAQILICSEIGSEGRNFQFAHHMIFFDVPISPDWVEQRIGRLDRIGQTETIKIHVPYVAGTISSFYTRWYHEGLNAFQSILAGGVLYRNEFGNELSQCAKKKDEKKLSALIGKTVKFRENLLKKLESGRDRLLELNSYDETVAKGLVKQIKEMDANGRMETFMLKMFEHFGVSVDELDKSFYKLTPTERYMEAFPGLPNDGVLATFDRTRALSRDDLAFLTWDHAMFSGACEMMLGSENGNSAFAVYPKSGQKGFLLEVIYILECTAPKELHLDRFLPTTPLRVVVNHNFEDVSEEYNHDEMRHALEDGQLQLLHEHKTLLQGIIPNMLKKARNLARKDKYQLVDDAIDTAHSDLGDELERLVNLQKVNDHITDKEIELLKERISNVDEHIRDSHLRLDAVRLILLQ